MKRQGLKRRGFLAGGAIFCGCCLRNGAEAQTPARLPVSVGGTRVRTVDAHAHCYFQDALDVLPAKDVAAVLPQTKGVPEHFLAGPGAVEGRLAAMDAMGIDMEIMSITPFW